MSRRWGPLLASLASHSRTIHDGLGGPPFKSPWENRNPNPVLHGLSWIWWHPCCVLSDLNELARHTAPFNGALASHLHHFSLAVRRTLSQSASWTLSSYDSCLCPQCSSQFREALPIELTWFSLLCSVLTLFLVCFHTRPVGFCFFSPPLCA